MSDPNITTAKLLALLNASATRPGKRKRTYPEPEVETVKLNKKRSLVTVQPPEEETATKGPDNVEEDAPTVEEEELDDDPANGGLDSKSTQAIPEAHFSNSPSILTPKSLEAISPPGEHSRVKWKINRVPLGTHRSAVVSVLENGKDGGTPSASTRGDPSKHFAHRFWKPFEARSKELPDSKLLR